MSLCSRSSRFASTTYPWVSMATPLIRSTWLLWLFSLSTPSNSFSLLLPFNCMFWPLRNLLCLLGYLLLWSWNWCSLLQLRSQVFLLLWSISSSLIRMTACSLSFFAYSNSYLMDLISSTFLPFVSTRKAISKQKIAHTLRSVIAISFWARSITFFIYSAAKLSGTGITRLTDVVQILEFIKRVPKLSCIILEFFLCFFEVLFWWHTLFQLLIFFIIL